MLTPQGKVIDLPAGATPLDFAYTLHTDLGHRTRGAKVNGNIVPLNYKLQTAQRVEILAAKQGAPSRDWLNTAHGYVQTARARAKLRHWFKYQNFDEDLSRGRTQLERELNRLGVTSVNQEKIAQKLSFNKLEDMLAAIGRGDVSDHQIAQAVQEITPVKATPVRLVTRAVTSTTTEGILIEGVGNLMTTLAKCCRVAPPDPIVGYVTSSRGVTIHHQDCALVLRLPAARRDRLLRAQWQSLHRPAAIELEVEAQDRRGLLRDLGDLFAKERVNVIKVNTLSEQDRARMRFMIEMFDAQQISRLLAMIEQVPGVVIASAQVVAD